MNHRRLGGQSEASWRRIKCVVCVRLVAAAFFLAGMTKVRAVDDEAIAEQVRRYDAACELFARTEEYKYAIEFSDDQSKSRYKRRAIVSISLTHDYGPSFPQLVADLAALEFIEGMHVGSEAMPRAEDLDAICKVTSLLDLRLSGPRITDDLLEKLSPLVNLRYFVACSSTSGPCPLTGKTLSKLDALPKLESLFLDGLKQWSPDAAAEVCRIRSLRRFGIIRMPTFTDADVAVLVQRKDWRRFDFGVCGVTNESLRLVAELPHLAHFEVDGECITDAGIKLLAASQSLEFLDLRFCPNLGDEAVDALAEMRKLRTVRLHDQNKITPAAVKRLAKKKPKLLIQHPAIDHWRTYGGNAFFD
jgi:hypothetical protein